MDAMHAKDAINAMDATNPDSPSDPPENARGDSPQTAMDALEDQWRAKWEAALRVWSHYVMLRPPQFFHDSKDARAHGLEESFAAISMVTLETSVDLQRVVEFHVEDFAMPVLCHEIGHHVLCPGNLADYARLIAIIRPVVGDQKRAALMENLFADFVVNDRLYSSRGLPMVELYDRLHAHTATLDQPEKLEESGSKLWTFYLRVYETWWRLPRGSLAGPHITREMDVDAGIAARILRVFGHRWLVAIKQLAYVFLKYLPTPDEISKVILPNLDWESIGDLDPEELGKAVYGLTSISPEEAAAADITELDAYGQKSGKGPSGDLDSGQNEPSLGQHRTPAQFGQILKDLGANLTPNQVAVQYYREVASPHLVPFPTIPQASRGKIPEGSGTWETGDELEALDYELSIYESPVVIPGITTRRRLYGEDVGSDEAADPLYLDVYVDCSGSMPNPLTQLSYLTLAAVIMSLSALRAGAKVQATLWSDYGRFKSTNGFIDDETELLGIVTGFVSGGTGFPLNVLRDTYAMYPETEPPAHIMVISDAGVDTMLDKDEQDTPGEEIAKMALEKCRGGGTLVLNMFPSVWNDQHERLKELGFDIFLVRRWQELEAFSREFSSRTYGQKTLDRKRYLRPGGPGSD